MLDPVLQPQGRLYETFPRTSARPSALWLGMLLCIAALLAFLLMTAPAAQGTLTQAFTRVHAATSRRPVLVQAGVNHPEDRLARPSLDTQPAKPAAWQVGRAADRGPLGRRFLTPLKSSTAKALLTFASGVALFVTSMSPEAAEAATSMVNSDYMLAAANSIETTLKDVKGLLLSMQDSRSAPPLATTELLDSVSQVFKGTIDDLGQLAAADTIGDIPKQGWFDKFVAIIESSILGLDKVLNKANVPGSLGISITIFTMGVKAILFPVNFAQLKSSVQMQAVQPKAKEIQERWKDTPQKMNIMLAELYKKSDVNPLLAIVPAFAQIPIFIGLYRALKHLGDLNLLDEPFLWLPSLEGPTFDLQAGHTLDWLTQGLLSQQDTVAYLSIPLILIVTQTLSTQLSKTPGQEIPTWVNFLPLLTASFALNVPSGLAVYWIVNTVITSAITIGVREYLKNDPGVIAARETDIDSLGLEEYQEAPTMPSYQEALLKAVEKDPELAAAFSEMRSSPASVMKYYGDKEFTNRLALAVQTQQQLMLQEQQARAAAVKAVPAVPTKVKENLCIAVKAGNMTGVKMYLETGTDPNFKDERSISALHYAVGKGRLDYLKMLVKAGGDINILDGQGNTLLHYAAGYGRDDIIKYLAEQKVDFSPVNDNKETPLDLAKREENKFTDKKTTALLEKYGAREGIGFGPVAPELLDAAEAKDASNP